MNRGICKFVKVTCGQDGQRSPSPGDLRTAHLFRRYPSAQRGASSSDRCAEFLTQNIQKLKDGSGLFWRPVCWHAALCRAISLVRKDWGSRLLKLSACHGFLALAAGFLRNAAFCAERFRASLRRYESPSMATTSQRCTKRSASDTTQTALGNTLGRGHIGVWCHRLTITDGLVGVVWARQFFSDRQAERAVRRQTFWCRCMWPDSSGLPARGQVSINRMGWYNGQSA